LADPSLARRRSLLGTYNKDVQGFVQRVAARTNRKGVRALAKTGYALDEASQMVRSTSLRVSEHGLEGARRGSGVVAAVVANGAVVAAAAAATLADELLMTDEELVRGSYSDVYARPAHPTHGLTHIYVM
jgi:hypothetical protein